MTPLKWQDPPESKRRKASKTRIDNEVRAVRKRPNNWLKVRDAASSGSYITYKKRGCQVRTVSVGNNKYDIYIMWDPDSKAAKEVLAEERKANGQ